MSEEEISCEDIDPNELLVCKKWDGIFKEVISDKKSNYFTKEGYFRLHDVGYFDKNGYLFVGGRSDDVMNVSGHRIASSEIESVTVSLNNIDEACAVPVLDSLYGNRVVLYFSSSIEHPEFISKSILDIKNIIFHSLTQYHVPKSIFYFRHLPKTKSGKIMRRIMRQISETNSFDSSLDLSTLANKDQFQESVITLLKSKS